MDDIVKSFGASFGTGISKKQGIVQDLNRNVMLGTLRSQKIINLYKWFKNCWTKKIT